MTYSTSGIGIYLVRQVSLSKTTKKPTKYLGLGEWIEKTEEIDNNG